MNQFLFGATRAIVVAAGLVAFSAEIAVARGGANFMNSPGYQRRLQESRGYVTNQSGSILPDRPAPVQPRPARRHRRH